MKRNWDVIRAILERIEAEPLQQFELYPGDFDPMDPETVAYHMRLLHGAGLIDGIPRDNLNTSPSFIATGMPWEGHELLDAMRNKTHWNRIKQLSRQKGVDLSFEAIKLLSKAVIENLLRA